MSYTLKACRWSAGPVLVLPPHAAWIQSAVWSPALLLQPSSYEGVGKDRFHLLHEMSFYLKLFGQQCLAYRECSKHSSRCFEPCHENRKLKSGLSNISLDNCSVLELFPFPNKPGRRKWWIWLCMDTDAPPVWIMWTTEQTARFDLESNPQHA